MKAIEATGKGNTKTNKAIKSLEKMIEWLGLLEEKDFPYEENFYAMNTFHIVQHYSYLTIYKQNPLSSLCDELHKAIEFANTDIGRLCQYEKYLLYRLSDENYHSVEQVIIEHFISGGCYNAYICESQKILYKGDRFALFTFRPLELVDLIAVNLIPFVPIGFLDCAAAHHDGRWMISLLFPVHDCQHDTHIQPYRAQKGKEKLLYIDELVRRGKLEDIGNRITLFELMHEPPCISLISYRLCCFPPSFRRIFCFSWN